MADGPVLVVTRLDDATADVVIEELNARGVPVARLDPGDFPGTVMMSAHVDVWGLSGALATATRRVSLERVRSVYWRRPSPYAAPPGLQPPDRQWCVDQSRFGLGGVLASLPGARYVNHPWRNRDAEYKPAQLAAAAACGLRIPATLVTNDLVEARSFARRHGPVVYKPLWHTDITDPAGRALTAWVEPVAPEDIDEAVTRSAHLFQQQVDKVADVRLTAVGRRLLAVRIDGARGMDWRREYDLLTYEPIPVPPEVEKGVHAYQEAFGLVFGAYDFALTRQGRFVLYECNPNGQWAWMPSELTVPVTTALADQLQRTGDDHDS